MKIIPILLCCATVWLLPRLSAQEMDFTPRYMQMILEGVSEERAYFSDGKSRWTFFLPEILKLTGSSGEAVFTLKDEPSAVIRFAKSPLTPETALTVPNFPLYREQAVKLFWSGVTDIKQLGERIDPYVMNDWKSHEFTFSFVIPGEALKRAVVFLNFSEKQQWVITITAPEEEFEKMNSLANMLLNSLHALPEDEKEVPAGT